MEDINKHTLILGIGNDILSDDAIGPKLVMELEKSISDPDVTCLTAALGGLEILEMIKDYKKVILIDAIRTRGGVPGAVYYLKPENFKETLHASSFHDVNFLTGLELAKKLDIAIPESIDILAVEIVEDLTFSNEFSPQIAEKYDDIVVEVKRFVSKAISNP